MKVGDIVQVVNNSVILKKNPSRIIARGILLRDISDYYFSMGYPTAPTHPYEILLSDGTIFRDWSNIWAIETWAEK
jgi:hypothetical protein